MSISVQRLVSRSRAWGLVASCVLALSAPCYALAQTANSNAGTYPSNPSTQPIPGNSPFTLVQPGSSTGEKPTKRTDNGKNEK